MRRGEHLYLIRNVLTGAVKVGSSGDVPSRLRQLAGNAGQPMELLAVVPGGGALERRLHTALIQDRTIGEWFSPSPQLLALIAEAQADRWPGRGLRRRRTPDPEARVKTPTIDPVGVVCCGECGEPLELRCKNGHDPLPIDVRADFSIEAERAPLPAGRQRRAPATPPVYAAKACACGTIFTPTGPNAKRCAACRARSG